MPKIISLFISFFLTSYESTGQSFNPVIMQNQHIDSIVEMIRYDDSIDVFEAMDIIGRYNDYPEIVETGVEYLFYYSDSLFGEVPVRVYIPENYDHRKATPTIIILHGAQNQPRFAFVDREQMRYVSNDSSDYTFDDLVDYFMQQDQYILIRPIADVTKGFVWASNASRSPANPSIYTLTQFLVTVKKFINIDDRCVYALGHSDGGDGAYGLQVLAPSSFAGFAVYNSTLTQILGQTYLCNALNRPLYLVHSDLDDIRPIQNTRSQVRWLDSLQAPILFKEYSNYQHQDRHLQKDVPFANFFLENQVRNPYPERLTWEASQQQLYNSVDWLKIISIDTTSAPAPWHREINFKAYDKRKKELADWDYYYYKYRSGIVNAYFNNNTFEIRTSRVTAFELLINPVMVNLENPVRVLVNGEEVFHDVIIPDKNFLLDEFLRTYDRQALWVGKLVFAI